MPGAMCWGKGPLMTGVPWLPVGIASLAKVIMQCMYMWLLVPI